MRSVTALELGEAFELPLVEAPFPVQPLDPPPPSEEELLAELDKLRREQEAAELELQSTFLNLIPFVGQIKGLIEAFSDEDLVTGRDLAWWERALNVASCLPIVHEAKGLVKVMSIVGHRSHQINIVVHSKHLYHPLKTVLLEKDGGH